MNDELVLADDEILRIDITNQTKNLNFLSERSLSAFPFISSGLSLIKWQGVCMPFYSKKLDE